MTATATWLGHATVLIEIGGLRVLTDPLLVNRLAFLTRVTEVVPGDRLTVGELDLIATPANHAHERIPFG